MLIAFENAPELRPYNEKKLALITEKDKLEEELNDYELYLQKLHNLSYEDTIKKQSLQQRIFVVNMQKKNLDVLKTDLEHSQKAKDELLDAKCTVEAKQIALQGFKDLKTRIINSQTSEVFGDIKWVMQEESKATEGSKKDKCYATLNNVSMDGVNTASKLVLGVKIIECVKRKYHIENMPIIFDIVDNIGRKALDEVKALSKGQIFCTKASFENEVPLHITSEE
jgi:hypothetical protein